MPRFGTRFQDSDHATSQHDEIMLWLDRNIRRVLHDLFPDLTGRMQMKVWEYPVAGARSVIGYVDLYIELVSEDAMHCICFEVKTKLLLGETIRQITFYRRNLILMRPIFVLVSPDDRYADILREQGILFYKYDPDLGLEDQ